MGGVCFAGEGRVCVVSMLICISYGFTITVPYGKAKTYSLSKLLLLLTSQAKLPGLRSRSTFEVLGDIARAHLSVLSRLFLL